MNDDVRAVSTNGNIFAVLGFEDPEAELARAHIASHLRDIIQIRNLTQSEVGAILGIDQPNVSLLMRGRTSGFTFERLITFLNRMGREVQINIYPTEDGKPAGHTSIHVYDEVLVASPARRANH